MNEKAPFQDFLSQEYRLLIIAAKGIAEMIEETGTHWERNDQSEGLQE